MTKILLGILQRHWDAGFTSMDGGSCACLREWSTLLSGGLMFGLVFLKADNNSIVAMMDCGKMVMPMSEAFVIFTC